MNVSVLGRPWTVLLQARHDLNPGHALNHADALDTSVLSRQCSGTRGTLQVPLLAAQWLLQDRASDQQLAISSASLAPLIEIPSASWARGGLRGLEGPTPRHDPLATELEEWSRLSGTHFTATDSSGLTASYPDLWQVRSRERKLREQFELMHARLQLGDQIEVTTGSGRPSGEVSKRGESFHTRITVPLNAADIDGRRISARGTTAWLTFFATGESLVLYGYSPRAPHEGGLEEAVTIAWLMMDHLTGPLKERQEALTFFLCGIEVHPGLHPVMRQNCASPFDDRPHGAML